MIGRGSVSNLSNGSLWLRLVSVLLVFGLVAFTAGCSTMNDVRVEETEEEETMQEAEADNSEPEPEPPAMPSVVQHCVNLLETPYQDPGEEARYGHQYTIDRFYCLATALEATDRVLEADSMKIDMAIASLERGAELLQVDWREPHTNVFRLSARSAARAIDTIQPAGEADLTVPKARLFSSAELSDDRMYLDQKDQIVTYFRTSAQIFRALFPE